MGAAAKSPQEAQPPEWTNCTIIVTDTDGTEMPIDIKSGLSVKQRMEIERLTGMTGQELFDYFTDSRDNPEVDRVLVWLSRVINGHGKKNPAKYADLDFIVASKPTKDRISFRLDDETTRQIEAVAAWMAEQKDNPSGDDVDVPTQPADDRGNDEPTK